MITYKIYRTVSEIPSNWDGLPVKDIFLKTPFLKALEASSPTNINTYFIGVFKSETLLGIAIIQRVQMYLDDVFRRTSNNKLKQIGKQLVSKFVRGNALVVGNLMHTGQHGIYFNSEKISQDDFLLTIQKAIDDLTIEIKLNFNKNIRIIVFKDYFETDTIHQCTSFFKKQNLYKVQVQPNMLFNVLDSWETPDNYISDFNKKYRRRYKTARKKIANLHCEELDEYYIEAHSNKLYELYEHVSNNARVNSFKLAKNHFLSLKQQLKANFKVFGYFLENELVGFYSLILNSEILETYFLGYNKALQQKHQMYLNMLFDMASFGIENNFKTIVYARTAMEIKSSIGATPNIMHVYLKHTHNLIANTVLKCVVKYMNPMRKWEERHPFN
ncbi:GNAT family N-acetyltransferase [Seonamhaeicola sediminis]|uniref:GNAT family N-acetyltransferase n=1 Tax=Seonamhaeicola sediminis TaxID=2528206 RepID=A0A562YGX5_9FLAO|nr:GNAT family N-acetyltransferase [Seonamhaeicola sediminis]TWO34021.1 GNAT family N-acetyltransferase [Seonamhaeicola sediminis]